MKLDIKDIPVDTWRSTCCRTSNIRGCFACDKSERKKNTERLKYASGAQLFLGVALLVLAIVAVNKQEDEEYEFYFIGGFTCGITGSAAGILGLYTSAKASSYNGDDVSNLQKELQCTGCLQVILGFTVLIMSMSGLMMNIMYQTSEDEIKTHVILSACMLSCIILLVIATFISFRSMETCCRCQGYNQRTTRTCPTTVGTRQYYQGQATYGQPAVSTPVHSTGGFNTHSNHSAYPVSQSFGMGQQQPPPVFNTGGFNANSNPPPYPVSQSYSTGQHPPPYGLQGTGQQPPPYGLQGTGQQPPPYGLQGTGQQPPPYGFQQNTTPTAPPPSYPY